MIEVKDVVKYYGSKKALDGISFSVEKGEIVGFLGPNGAGKTTTMRIITGYLSPTMGSVTVAGIDVQEEPVEAKKHIGYLPENVPLYNEMPVQKYLYFFANLKGVPKEKQKEHIFEIMEKTGILKVSDTIIGKLSKGYRQRVGIAQALIGNPDVLILDEPTIGLDPTQVVEIRNLIKELGKEKTIFFSSHILQEVSAICERIIVINEGKIIAQDTQQSLLETLESGLRIKLVVKGELNKITDILNSMEGIIKVEHIQSQDSVHEFIVTAQKNREIRNEVAREIITNNFDLLELSKVKLTLEEVFLKLTKEEQ